MKNAFVKKRLIFFVFFLFSFTAFPAYYNFLPMEDGLSPYRNPVYGISVDNLKPYRHPMPMEDVKITRKFDFDSQDILLCVLLVGVYFVFVHKRSKSRNVEL